MTDTTPQRQRTTKKPNIEPSSKNTPHRLVHNVTAENYQEVGSAFVGMYGGAVIALADCAECKASPRQWGAWRAYLASRKISVKFMDARGKEGKCWTVPAAWPHEFDSGATVHGDQEAANWFMRNYRPERLDLASAAQRAATVAAMKTKMPPPHRYPRYEAEPDEPKTTFIDNDKLLQDYEKDMAELRARNAKDVSPPQQDKAA